MRAVFGLVLIIGVALAGFAIYMVQGYFEQQNAALVAQRAEMAQIVPTVDVYAVNRVIEFGETITPDDIHVIKYVTPFVPEGVFRTEEELFPNGTDVLRVVLRQMEANEPIMAIKVTAPGEDAGITTRLARGMRAFAVRVDVASGVSGFLNPGDRVDIYWTGRVDTLGAASLGDVTQLIEANVRIVAVDQTSEGGRSSATIARTVTVEVTPEQVAALAQAQSTGKLSLSLLGREDDTIASAIEVNQASLLGIAPALEIAPIAVEQVCTIKTRRGAEVVNIPIPCTN